MKVSRDLWLQLMTVLRLARASTFHQTVCPQSTRPTLKGGLTTNTLFQCPSGTVRRPSRTLCSYHRNYPWCTLYTTATSHSSQYLPKSGQGQGKSPKLLTSPPPTWDSLLPSRIPHGGASRLNSIHQPHHPTSITHHISRNTCNYDGSKCK
jgi:hypothetical protein